MKQDVKNLETFNIYQGDFYLIFQQLKQKLGTHILWEVRNIGALTRAEARWTKDTHDLSARTGWDASIQKILSRPVKRMSQ